MKVAIVGSTAASPAVRQLLAPWRVSYASVEEADVTIWYGTMPRDYEAGVVIPSDTLKFHRWLETMSIKHSRIARAKFRIPISDGVSLTLIPQFAYRYERKNLNRTDLFTRTDRFIILTVDVIQEYYSKLSEVLNPKLSLRYRIITGLPISYQVVPPKIRDFGLKIGSVDYTFENHLKLDALRYLLAGAIEDFTGKQLRRNEHKCACLMTHDVDTKQGLIRALALKKTEEKYDIPSTWFVPTERYELDKEIVQNLANHGELGSHGTRHDGKLMYSPQKKIEQRLIRGKRALEKITGKELKGFRAPLLQFHEKILTSLKHVGYAYDASISAWEPRHTTTMKPHGIETVNSLQVNGMLEIPLTLPQDHQMIHVMGMHPKKTVEEWLRLVSIIRKIKGICVFLVHPDYELANQQNLRYYEELLQALSGNDYRWMTPSLTIKQ